MYISATLKRAGFSAQKARLIADMIRGLNIFDALMILSFNNKFAARVLKKVLESAVANAEHNNGLDVDELYVCKVFVDDGPVLKRTIAKAKGRANRILKRTCHITVCVSSLHEGKS